MKEFNQFLEEVGKQGNHWMDYHIIMGKVRTYEKKYKIKTRIFVE
jgi:hypothetical protein